ncbi:hypothetical protein HPB47_009417 [Ixodes persulcatus]|uniref:Uncharacterized protein n=1 Tax=Ixodes persulcatus TaxID=34615 RepID=A0AC60P245_IXOPE|nr:hypothetical protein HPB47_009417 [Ixodes persulcatus]
MPQPTAVSEPALHKLSADFQKSGRVATSQIKYRAMMNCNRTKKLEDIDLGVFRRKVHDFCRKNEMPTVAKKDQVPLMVDPWAMLRRWLRALRDVRRRLTPLLSPVLCGRCAYTGQKDPTAGFQLLRAGGRTD